MNIQDLLYPFVADPILIQNLNFEVTGLSLNTKTLKQGDLFFAMKGHQQDGRAYLLEAIQKGACALVIEQENSHLFPIFLNSPIPVILIQALDQKISDIAGRYYGDPSHYLSVIGITGTNGKTTCAHLLSASLTNLGIPCAMMGTLTHTLTTPDAITVQGQLAEFRRKGMKAVAMEVSSHGLDQYRVHGVHFESAIFTNLTQDHLDYHFSMSDYGAAKQKLFRFKSLKRMILNADDPFTQTLLELNTDKPIVLCSLKPNILGEFQKNYLSISASTIQLNTEGVKANLHTPWGEGILHSKLLGDFNVSNIMSVLSELYFQGIPLEKAIESLKNLGAPPGRMERFHSPSGVTIIIDHAHTPDALYNVLRTVRQSCEGKLWCVFGCGGDRDKLKRPKMGQIVATMADKVIITADNSRHEPTMEIIKEILTGIPSGHEAVSIEEDREKAIHYAIHHALALDVILIAGKGHEAYQQIGDHFLTFSDSACVQMYFNERA